MMNDKMVMIKKFVHVYKRNSVFYDEKTDFKAFDAFL